jgi:hypothetical protein
VLAVDLVVATGRALQSNRVDSDQCVPQNTRVAVRLQPCRNMIGQKRTSHPTNPTHCEQIGNFEVPMKVEWNSREAKK